MVKFWEIRILVWMEGWPSESTETMRDNDMKN